MICQPYYFNLLVVRAINIYSLVALGGYLYLSFMIEAIWKKEVVIEVTLDQQDNADWIQPLPLLFSAKWNHYIGFYLEFLQEFFTNHQPYPYQLQNSWLSVSENNLELNGTQIISNLYILYALPKQGPLKLTIKFRKDKDLPKIDLKKYYKNSLKASTCIRYGRFGSSVITVDMTVNNVDDMFYNFYGNNYGAFMGSTEPESEKLGFHFIISNKQRIQNLGIRILWDNLMIERSVSKSLVLSSFIERQLGNDVQLRCHGVSLNNSGISFGDLQLYCHPDGFLYFTM